MTSPLPRLLAVVTVSIAAVSLAACAGSGTGTGADTTTSEPAVTATSEPSLAAPLSSTTVEFCESLAGAEATGVSLDSDPDAYLAMLRGLRTAAPAELAEPFATYLTAVEDLASGQRDGVFDDPAVIAALEAIEWFAAGSCVYR